MNIPHDDPRLRHDQTLHDDHVEITVSLGRFIGVRRVWHEDKSESMALTDDHGNGFTFQPTDFNDLIALVRVFAQQVGHVHSLSSGTCNVTDEPCAKEKLTLPRLG